MLDKKKIKEKLEKERDLLVEQLKGIGKMNPKTGDWEAVPEDLGYKDLPLAGQNAYTLVKGKDTPQPPRGYAGRAGLYEVMDVTHEGLKVVELAPGVTRELIQSKSSDKSQVEPASSLPPAQVASPLKLLRQQLRSWQLTGEKVFSSLLMEEI